MLRGSTLDLSLRGSCAKLARIWAETFSFLASLSFFMFSSIKLQIETPGGLEHGNCMKQPMLQIQARCRVATQT